MPAPVPTIITGSNGIGGVTLNSLQYDCVMGSWRGRFNKQFYSQVTFCSGGWMDESAGMKQFIGVATGYLSHGNALSDPLAPFANPVPVVLQADGPPNGACQLTMTLAHLEIDVGVIAAANSEFGVGIRSKGAVSSTWNVTT